MYERAPRVLISAITDKDINPNVGPSTYGQNEKKLSSEQTKRESYAPFSSLTPRVSTFDEMVEQHVAPGAGAYDVAVAASKLFKTGAKVSVFGRSKDQRFREMSKNLEKRDSYPSSINVATVSERPLSKLSTTSTFMSKSPNRPRVVIDRDPTPASIPSPQQANGYDEEPNGSLKPRPPPILETHEENITRSEHTRAPKFEASRGHCLDDYLPTSQTPGPGAYTVKIPATRANGAPNMKKGSFGRFSEMVERTELKKGIPEPGRYEIWASNVDLRPKKGSSFASKTPRFKERLPTQTPGPGFYDNISHTAIVKKRNKGRTAVVPFGTATSRFDQPPVDVLLRPGPGTYSVDQLTSLGHQSKIVADGAGKNCAFGSLTKRSLCFEPAMGVTIARVSSAPGPATYNTSEKFLPVNVGNHDALQRGLPSQAQQAVTERLLKQLTSRQQNMLLVYQGNTIIAQPITSGGKSNEADTKRLLLALNRKGPQRFDDSELRAKAAVPNPVHYKPEESFKKKQEHGKLPVHSAFAQQVGRPATEEHRNIPGPGAYNHDELFQKTTSENSETDKIKRGIVIAQVPDVDVHAHDPDRVAAKLPGPGFYDAQKLTDTRVQKTFNVTLSDPDPVVQRKLKLMKVAFPPKQDKKIHAEKPEILAVAKGIAELILDSPSQPTHQ